MVFKAVVALTHRIMRRSRFFVSFDPFLLCMEFSCFIGFVLCCMGVSLLHWCMTVVM